jgi:nitrilase
MTDSTSQTRVIVAQLTPVLFDPHRTADRVVATIHEAGRRGAQLVLFPEAYLPGYPRGLSFDTVVGNRGAMGREQYRWLWESAIDVPGPITQAIAQAARESGVHVVIGAVERVSSQHRTLYCSMLYFTPEHGLVARHRKLRPTGSERLMWGEGDGSDLQVHATTCGRLGGLICWENYMPLARSALYAQGIELYLAPTADARDTWQATLQHIACEGRCFVLGCNQFVRRSDYPSAWGALPEIQALPEVACRGGSAIYSPYGALLAGPVYDREELLQVDLDLAEVTRARFDFDPAGHYARNDVFELRLKGPLTPPAIIDGR